MKTKYPTKKQFAALLVLAGTVLSGTAVAQPDGPGGPPRDGGGQCQKGGDGPRGHRPPPFEELDADGDGKLSAEEAAGIPPVQHRGFEAFDEDGDGYLSREELPAPPQRGDGRGPRGEGRGPRGEGRGPHGEGRGHHGGDGRPGPPDFAALDTDGDGKLSAEEAEVIPPVRHEGIEAFDTNSDGFLTEDELPTPPRHGGGPRGPRGEGGPRGHRPPPFEELDTDGDGKLSAEEAADIPPVQHHGFAEFDDDGDGFLSREELPAPPQHRGQGRGPNHARAEGKEVPYLTNVQPKGETY